MLHTGAGLLTAKQVERLDALFANDAHVEVEITWAVYQRMIGANPVNPTDGPAGSLMVALIDALAHAVPAALTEVVTLGHTLARRAPPTCSPTSTAPAHPTDQPSDQRSTRTPPWLRPRLPQPHQLHRPQPPRNRRLQTPTTPSIVKSRKSLLVWSQLLRSPASACTTSATHTRRFD